MQKIHINIQEGQKIWFTSDLHFSHRNILKFCNRPWENTTQMEKGLVENWNSVVGDNDIVFVLGDTFWFNDSQHIRKVLAQLKGKEIYLIPGNHDDFEAYHRVTDPRIHLCADVVCCWFTEENQPIQEVWLSHYPMMTWPHRERGAYQFFGHIHSEPDKTEGVDQDLPLHWNQADAGCDFWKWTPVDIDTLMTYCKMKKDELDKLTGMFDKLRRLSQMPEKI